MSREERVIKKHLEKHLPPFVVLHSLRTAVIAQNIAAEENADEDVAYFGGLIHDLGLEKGIANHAVNGVDIARKLFEKNHIFPDIEDVLLEIIHTHLLEPEPRTAEGWIVSDADIIERIGPLGIHRLYVNALHLSKLAPEDMLGYLEQALETTAQIHTATARSFAKKDTQYLKTFIERLEEDADVEDE